MPKKIAKKDLPSIDSVAAAKPLLEAIEKRNAAVASAREAATKDGAVVKHDPKYRTARKKLKRVQRRRGGIRHNVPVKAAAAGPAPAAAPEPEPGRAAPRSRRACGRVRASGGVAPGAVARPHQRFELLGFDGLLLQEHLRYLVEQRRFGGQRGHPGHARQ
jgi:hypothetical protein